MIQESPTLDLVNDCSRFVTRHFEVISTSSPHIYHSALLLTPRESIVRNIYESHAEPFVRVVNRLPALWDSNTAAATTRPGIDVVAWSPCNRIIAISPWDTLIVDILDSVTLLRLQSLKFSWEISARPEALTFSPDSHILTSFIRGYCYPNSGGVVVSWDLQTGGVISAIEWKGPRYATAGGAYITYSANGKMVAVLFRFESSTIISICNVFSGVCMNNVYHYTYTQPHPALGAPYVYKIWTHVESLRFATREPTKITIWEVAFALEATPVEVDVISIPGDIAKIFVFESWKSSDIAHTEFHPGSCRLAFINLRTGRMLWVWDARASKFLLHHTGVNFHRPMSFSSNGNFFACSTNESEVYLWKESLTGYTLLERFTTGTPFSKPYFSPCGGSILTFGGCMVQLWHAKSVTTATSSALSQVPQGFPQDFILEFLPDRLLSVTTQKGDKTVMVLDLKSGLLWLTIDTSIEVYGLRLIGNTIVVIGDKKAITWNLLGGDFPSNTRMTIEDSTGTINFNNMSMSSAIAASISLDLQYIAHAEICGGETFLNVYCTSSEHRITERVDISVHALQFSPDGEKIWCVSQENEADVFTITLGTMNHTETITHVEYGSCDCPWGSPHGYKVTNDGWLLGTGGKRLLMLPPPWRSTSEVHWAWDWKFLALLHRTLPEPVILELEP